MSSEPKSIPLLRTLAPALKELERRLRVWLGAKRRYPLTTLQRAALEGLADDLLRQADALQLDRPLLTIMLMGGTGVGKSTLLNALAGGAIAQASFARPTTRDPVVYYHSSVQTTRLDPALQFCRLASHDRVELEQKILVDTPDLDSNDLSNRDKLLRLLPVADIVLYVGSQEKYHDKLGWELFLEQRKRRAFAFVLNKWDRCQHAGAAGLRPDDDLIRDLNSEGFVNPLVFRTCAQHWVDKPYTGNGDVPPIEGEQFGDLVRWLELGLSRVEIEAIKARGVGQLLHQLEETMRAICPPDLTEFVDRVRGAWTRQLGDEANGATTVLLNTLDPFQREIEHHFAIARQQQFSGLMGLYLLGINKMRYTGSTLRDQIPFVGRGSSGIQTPQEWSLVRFTEACSAAASEQHLSARLKAMTNRLLIEADTLGIPLDLIQDGVESTARLDWKARYAQAMIEIIGNVERAWSHPTGTRRGLQLLIIFLADWLPSLTLLIGIGVVLWGFFVTQNMDKFAFVAPFAAVGLVLISLHVAIALCLPMRWRTIRGQLEEGLEQRLRSELEKPYHQVLADVVADIESERRQNEAFVKEIEDVAGFLSEREQAASIVGLYGK